MNGRTLKALVEGVTPEWGRIRNRVPEVGRYLVESDVETRATVALLGQKIKKDVFGDEEAIGREILIRGMRFRIVGILKKFGNNQVNDGEMERDNSKIYIPLIDRPEVLRGHATPSTPGPSRPTPRRWATRRRRPRPSCAAATAASPTSRSRTSARRSCASARRSTS